MAGPYRVDNISKVNTMNYKEGDIFYTPKTFGILIDGKIKTFGGSGITMNDVDKRIDEKMKAGENDE